MMKTIEITGIRSVGIEEFVRGPAEPAKEVLCKFVQNNDELTALSNSLTLILNRDIRSSMEHASYSAIFLAQKFPERKVLLVNTYAGPKFMRETLLMGIASSELPLPRQWKYGVSAPASAKFGDDDAESFLTNFGLMNCPIGTFDASRLEVEIQEHGYDIIILNSFEFSSLGRHALWSLAKGLVELREHRKLSMIVYSQQFRAGISPYFIGRGPIGMMAPYSDAIWKVYSDFENVHISKKSLEKISELNNEESNRVH